jgi:hypothetical protein
MVPRRLIGEAHNLAGCRRRSALTIGLRPFDSNDLLALHRSLIIAGCSTAGLWLQRGQMSWRDEIARFFALSRRTRLDGVEAWPSHDIDPIEELARIINEA